MVQTIYGWKDLRVYFLMHQMGCNYKFSKQSYLQFSHKVSVLLDIDLSIFLGPPIPIPSELDDEPHLVGKVLKSNFQYNKQKAIPNCVSYGRITTDCSG